MYDKGSQLFTALQGFVLGAIVMGFVADYNRNVLPMALMLWIGSILLRLGEK